MAKDLHNQIKGIISTETSDIRVGVAELVIEMGSFVKAMDRDRQERKEQREEEKKERAELRAELVALAKDLSDHKHEYSTDKTKVKTTMWLLSFLSAGVIGLIKWAFTAAKATP